MAHGDYHCCAICDRKMEYADYDARTKDDICLSCMKAAHEAGVPVYNGEELAAWINANPDKARDTLPSIGFCKCFYRNPVDEAFALATQEPTNE